MSDMVKCYPLLLSRIWSRVNLYYYPGYGYVPSYIIRSNMVSCHPILSRLWSRVILYYYVEYGHVSSYIIIPDMVTCHPILLCRIWSHVILY